MPSCSRCSAESFSSDPLNWGCRDGPFRAAAVESQGLTCLRLMQRLFSTFPNSAPGGGLLLLRLAVAIPFLVHADTWGSNGGNAPDASLRTLEAACGLLLLLGAWTPVVGIVLILLETALVVRGAGPVALDITRGAICASLLLLGPGAWSVDARRFGRKRIDV